MEKKGSQAMHKFQLEALKNSESYEIRELNHTNQTCHDQLEGFDCESQEITENSELLARPVEVKLLSNQLGVL